MKKILILGAGRSSGTMIQYLIAQALKNNWFVTVCDNNIDHARLHTSQHTHCTAIYFDANNAELCDFLISTHDIAISMLPPVLHDTIAKVCLKFSRHLLTASYVSPTIKEMDKELQKAGVLFLCEMGLDPGIDHMSAMKCINDILQQDATIYSFKSYCGGLVSPSYDDNPWHYKVSWNPRNVVLAGQGNAKYLYRGTYKYLPYYRLFKETEFVTIPGYGILEAYPNRDSLSYKEIYGLHNASTMIRGTLRQDGFCKAWQALVDMGYTDDTYNLMHTTRDSYSLVTQSLLPSTQIPDVEMAALDFLKMNSNDNTFKALQWLGLFNNDPIPINNPTPAYLLQTLLENKMVLKPNDKDLIIMKHEIGYILRNKKYLHTSTLTIEGNNSSETAMAKAVGLPLAFMAEQMLIRPVQISGVHIPIIPEIYIPILSSLAEAGVVFNEETQEIPD